MIKIVNRIEDNQSILYATFLSHYDRFYIIKCSITTSMEEKSDIFFHRKLRKKCYFRLILIISLYIIKLVLIFFLFLIYFYRRDVMTCLLLFQLHERLKYVGIILKILKNRTKVPLSRHQKCEKWKCKNFQERIRLHKYEKYLKIILQLFKTDLVYRYFNLKKKNIRNTKVKLQTENDVSTTVCNAIYSRDSIIRAT